MYRRSLAVSRLLLPTPPHLIGGPPLDQFGFSNGPKKNRVVTIKNKKKEKGTAALVKCKARPPDRGISSCPCDDGASGIWQC